MFFSCRQLRVPSAAVRNGVFCTARTVLVYSDGPLGEARRTGKLARPRASYGPERACFRSCGSPKVSVRLGPKCPHRRSPGDSFALVFFSLRATTSSRRITLHSTSLRSPATSLFAVPMPRARTGGGPRRGGADREAALNFFRPFDITAR
jgi:hypothetical protein